jgi:hypothetical protein
MVQDELLGSHATARSRDPFEVRMGAESVLRTHWLYGSGVREQGVDKPVDNAENRWSGGEPRAALGAAAADDGPSAGRAHAFPEAVAALPATIVGLECALHEGLSKQM